jgi:hypothetical protein
MIYITAYLAFGIIASVLGAYNAVEVDENNEVIKTPERA